MLSAQYLSEFASDYMKVTCWQIRLCRQIRLREKIWWLGLPERNSVRRKSNTWVRMKWLSARKGMCTLAGTLTSIVTLRLALWQVLSLPIVSVCVCVSVCARMCLCVESREPSGQRLGFLSIVTMNNYRNQKHVFTNVSNGLFQLYPSCKYTLVALLIIPKGGNVSSNYSRNCF